MVAVALPVRPPSPEAELHGYAAAWHGELLSLAYLLTGDWKRAARVVERALADGYRRGELDHDAIRDRAVRLALRRRPAPPDPADPPLWTAVRRLRPAQRAALVLSVHAGLSVAEIGNTLGRPDRAVHRLLDRAVTSVSRATPGKGD